VKPDRIEALVKEIAAKHGIAVGRDDPIMILQTINERLMQDSAAAQQDALDRFKEELESIAHRWGEDARAKAERSLTTALAAGRAAMAKDMQAGAKAAALSARQEIDTALAQLADPIRDGRRIAILNLIAAGMAVFAAALALLSTL
jgi:plasmid stabilization system protein ParE